MSFPDFWLNRHVHFYDSLLPGSKDSQIFTVVGPTEQLHEQLLLAMRQTSPIWMEMS